MLSLPSPCKLAATAALVFAALGAASSAQAHSNVTFSFGIQVPGAYGYDAPVYLPPQQVYVQPQPVYLQPRPVFIQPRGYGQYYGNGRGWHGAQWERARRHERRDGGDDDEERGGHQD